MVMHSIFKYIKPTTYNKEQNHVTLTLRGTDVAFTFNYTYSGIIVEHKSQAVIAAVIANNGQRILYKNTTIEATNSVLQWLDIEYDVTTNVVEEVPTISGDGVISFF
jgi:hypothetical protein